MGFGLFEIKVWCKHCGSLLDCELKEVFLHDGTDHILWVDTRCEGCQAAEDQRRTDAALAEVELG